VNPTQFAPGEDLARYPRDLERDAAIAETESVDLLFVPSVDEMYPPGGSTTVHVGALGETLCGASRPGHFDGVATVVTKLFSIVGPCRAYFGRKDAQQLAIIRRLVVDLDLPVVVLGQPLVRDADGLALSSRNEYLDADERRAATVIARALAAAAAAVAAGERDAARLRAVLAATIGSEPLVRLDYAEVVDGSTLAPVSELGSGETLLAVAAFVGSTRLIDNVVVSSTAAGVVTDLGRTLSTPSLRGM
jgi:pantoate--beta-alanine ligase